MRSLFQPLGPKWNTMTLKTEAANSPEMQLPINTTYVRKYTNRHKYRSHEKEFSKNFKPGSPFSVYRIIETKPGVSSFYLTTGIGGTVQETARVPCLTIRKVGNEYQKDYSYKKEISHTLIVGNLSRTLLVFYVYLVYFYVCMPFSFTEQIFNTT